MKRERPSSGEGVPTILVAPDSFKGTYSAAEVAAAIARGVRAGGAEALEMPVADGGEGTLEAILAAKDGEERRDRVSGPTGTPVHAAWGWVADERLAIIEAAQACGLHLSGLTAADALRATTAGVGELILRAVDAGARRVIVAVGGSATSDGGSGALRALGERLLPDGVRVEVLVDVNVPFERAAEVFARQKGADERTVEVLSARLAAQGAALAERFGRDPRGRPRTGGAGGLSGALWAALDATLVSGADAVLDLLGIDARLRGADALIVGEGCLDVQTLQGKIVSVLAARAGAVPRYAVVGRDELPPADRARLGVHGVWTAPDPSRMEAAGRAITARVLHGG